MKGQYKTEVEFTHPYLKAKFILIPAGTFMMGSPGDESGRYDDIEEQRHRVTISKPFYLQTTVVTQSQWNRVMDRNPSYFKGDDELPVEQVSWDGVQVFLEKLNSMEEGTDNYCLPSEAEWEYACRAGSRKAYCFGDDPDLLDEYAWYKDNSGGKTLPVGLKKPNAWGLYDMHGNVWEWVQDRYGFYPTESVTDPFEGTCCSSHRVLRGGGWDEDARHLRCAVRVGGKPNIPLNSLGFRLLRERVVPLYL